MKMNPYLLIGTELGVTGDEPLLQRIAQWHDAMVAHERATRPFECDDECPHAEARRLWAEATAMFGRGAQRLSFLKSRALALRKAA